MTNSVLSSIEPRELQSLHDTVVEFRTDCADWERELQTAFQEMDALRGEFLRRLSHMDQQQARTDAQRQHVEKLLQDIDLREAALAANDAELTNKAKNLDAERQRLVELRQQIECDANREESELREQLHSLRHERDMLSKDLDQAKSDNHRLATIETDVQQARTRIKHLEQQLQEQQLLTEQATQEARRLERDLRTQLDEAGEQREQVAMQLQQAQTESLKLKQVEPEIQQARTQIERLEQQLQEQQLLTGRAAQEARQLESDLRTQLDEAEEQRKQLAMQLQQALDTQNVTPTAGNSDLGLAELEQERDSLEAELELVRSRAAELDETLEKQQRDMVHQRSEIGEELKQLRRLVEAQTDLTSGKEPRPAKSQRSKTPPSTAGALPDDPVITSVKAQFAKLQRDVANRRRRNTQPQDVT